MNLKQLEKSIDEALKIDPIEMIKLYYRQVIQSHADQIAIHQKEIHKLEKRLEEL